MEPVTKPQSPSVGRIVHFVPSAEVGCRAAIVTEKGVFGMSDDPDSPAASLCVFGADGVSFEKNVDHSFDNKPGTWHWPERV